MSGQRNPGSALACSLERKRCLCGRQVTAKQLIQYAACAACVKARAAAAAPQQSEAQQQ